MGVIKTLTTVGGLTTAAGGGDVETADVADGAITPAKMSPYSAGSLLGRGVGGGTGPPQEISLGSNLSMSGTTLNAAGGSAFPAGFLAPFAGPAVPSGWLNCNGASYLRSDWPALFAAIGTTWGAVDATHFNVPDLRGRALIGVGTGDSLTPRDLADFGGEEEHVLTGAESAQHQHTIPDPGHTHGLTDPGHHHDSPVGVFLVSGTGTPIGTAGTDFGDQSAVTTTSTTGATVDSALTGISQTTEPGGPNAAHNTMPPWAALYWLIKT